MTRYDIVLSGCDDATYLLGAELVDDEHATLARVADLANQVGGGCRPTMRVCISPSAPEDGAVCEECWEPFAASEAAPVRDGRGEWRHATCREVAW